MEFMNIKMWIYQKHGSCYKGRTNDMYMCLASGLKWLMKYDHKKFISLYLMTWNDSLLVELSSKVRQYD